jgi:amicyanin
MKLSTLFALLVSLATFFSAAANANPVDVVSPSEAPADAVKVDIAKMKFAPSTLDIAAGTVVVWTNHDAVPHNVYLPAPIEVVGQMLRAGQSLALKFNEPGDYSYICSPHPYMKGKVTVKAK